MDKIKSRVLRLVVVALVGAFAPVLVGVQAAHAYVPCSVTIWKLKATSSTVSSAPYSLTTRLYAEYDSRDSNMLCTNRFRAVATLTASNNNGAGGTLTATVFANTTSPGPGTSVPLGASGTWTAADVEYSGSNCAYGRGNFRSMVATTAQVCVQF